MVNRFFRVMCLMFCNSKLNCRIYLRINRTLVDQHYKKACLDKNRIWLVSDLLKYTPQEFSPRLLVFTLITIISTVLPVKVREIITNVILTTSPPYVDWAWCFSPLYLQDCKSTSFVSGTNCVLPLTPLSTAVHPC